MKNLKYEQGETVLVDGKECIIEVAKKDFSTQAISYKLKDGRIVSEARCKPPKGGKVVQMSPLHTEYKALFGKAVPKNKMKDEAWIQTKIDNQIAENTAANELKVLQEQFIEVVKTTIPTDKLEDIEWLKAEIEAAETDPTDEEKYNSLKELCEEQGITGLSAIILAKELDIDAEDYEEAEDLLVAICEEMNIVIPTEEAE